MKKYLGVIAGLAVCTAIWQGAASLIQWPGLPGPAKTAAALIRLAFEGRLWQHTGASLSRIMFALIAGIIPASALGLAAGRLPWFNRLVSPFIYLLLPLPKAAFLPVIMLFLGLGEGSKIFLISFIIFSQILVTVRDAARQIAPELLDSVRSLGAWKGALLYHVVVPAVLPGFFTALRVSLGTAIAVLFLAETFASESGLGYLIVDAWTRIAYAEMYAAIAALSILGLLLFILVDVTEILLCPWNLP
jgi:NitT/TauT family transport system permease protein